MVGREGSSGDPREATGGTSKRCCVRETGVTVKLYKNAFGRRKFQIVFTFSSLKWSRRLFLSFTFALQGLFPPTSVVIFLQRSFSSRVKYQRIST